MCTCVCTHTCIHIFYVNTSASAYAHTLVFVCCAFVCFVRSRPHMCIHTQLRTHTLYRQIKRTSTTRSAWKSKTLPSTTSVKASPRNLGLYFLFYFCKISQKDTWTLHTRKASLLNLGLFFRTQFGFFWHTSVSSVYLHTHTHTLQQLKSVLCCISLYSHTICIHSVGDTITRTQRACVCMYVHTHTPILYTHTHTYTHTYMRIHVCMHIYACIYVCKCMVHICNVYCMRMHACMHACIFIQGYVPQRVYAYVYTHSWLIIQKYTSIYLKMFMCIHMCVCVCVCVCVCTRRFWATLYIQ